MLELARSRLPALMILTIVHDLRTGNTFLGAEIRYIMRFEWRTAGQG